MFSLLNIKETCQPESVSVVDHVTSDRAVVCRMVALIERTSSDDTAPVNGAMETCQNER